MNEEQQIQSLEHTIEELISAEPELFLVEIKIKPTNNIRVYIDADHGISLDKLVQYNRRLYKHLEESNMFPNGDFSLEVSSPGLDEPLKLHRQYLKNIGRYVEVLEKDGNKKEGKLLQVTASEITIEEKTGKNKKERIVEHVIAFEDIKSTRIQIKF